MINIKTTEEEIKALFFKFSIIFDENDGKYWSKMARLRLIVTFQISSSQE
jgi:hypothetical protein